MAFIDVETTGLEVRVEDIIEIAVLKFDATGESAFVGLCTPERPVSVKIEQLTGISKERVQKALRIEDALDRVRKMLEGVELLVAHNAQYDLAMLKWVAERRSLPPVYSGQFACTRYFANALFPRKSHKLKDVCKFYGIGDDQTHRALDDLHMTAQVFCKMYPIIQEMGVPWVNSVIYNPYYPDGRDTYGLTDVTWYPWGFIPQLGRGIRS